MISNGNRVDEFWRSHNFRMEPWGNNYEQPIQIVEDLALSESDVNPTVETEDWENFESPKARSLPNHLIFIDGRRRIDAPLVGGDGNSITYGVFGTIAVGAVLVDRTIPQASCTEISIRRVLGFGGEQEAISTLIPCPLGSKAKLLYEAVKRKSENTPLSRTLIVQTEMLAAEEELVKKVATKDANTLVIRDGPLRYESPIFTLGYVKTMHKNYLTEKYAALLWQLLPGQRTPIFKINIQNKSRLSWYLKSGNSQHSPQKAYHDLHGIVRLELSGNTPWLEAQEIANRSTDLIPKYASHPSRDPRAPQNLTPVGALERELGRYMGDAGVIQRRVQHFLASCGGSK